MKVLILGGAGGVGLPAARRLASSDLVSEMVLAGRSADAAGAAAAEVGDKAMGVRVDLHDGERLSEVASGCDLVVNASGPDFETPLPALRAAIGAGAHYCDAAADGHTTERALELDADAARAGVAALVGIGWAPGATNLLAKHAASRLGEVDEVQFGYAWGLSAESARDETERMRRGGRVNASWQTVVHFTTGLVRMWRDGAYVDVDPFANSVEVTLSGVVRQCIPIGSSEPRTLPHHLPGLRSVTSLCCPHPPQLAELWRDVARRADLGELTTREAVIELHETAAADPHRWIETSVPYPVPFFWFSATGASKGQRARWSAELAHWTGTGEVLAVAALTLLRGDVEGAGVFPPEACLDFEPFFSEVYAVAPDDLLIERFDVV